MNRSWTIKGNVSLVDEITPNTTGLGDEYIQPDERETAVNRPLAFVELRVRASKKGPDKKYKSWGRVFTDDKGNFSLTVEEKDVPHIVGLSVRFENENLKLRAKAYEGWHTIASTGEMVDTDEVNFNVLITSHEINHRHKKDSLHSGPRDLNPRIPMKYENHKKFFGAGVHKRAWHWFVTTKLISYLEEIERPFRKKIKVHLDNVNLVGGDSWANGFLSQTANIGSGDSFVPNTLLHELMHLWHYQHNSGVTNWISAAIRGVHELQVKPVIALHEGFATFCDRELMHLLFGAARPRVRSKKVFLDECINTLEELERNDMAVSNILTFLCDPEVYSIDLNSEIDTAVYGTRSALCINRGAILTFADVLQVFYANAEAGYPQELEAGNNEFGIYRFLTRAAAVLENFDEVLYEALLKALDPLEESTMGDVCTLQMRRVV